MTKHFTINRATWANHNTRDVIGAPYLLNPSTGAQCCVGFYSEACGVPGGALAGRFGVNQLHVSEQAKLGIPHDAFADLYVLNDRYGFVEIDGHISTAQREANITSKFAQYGVTVDFVGEYPAGTK
jgi:hypothetical protein